VVILHKAIHELQRKKVKGGYFETRFWNAYHKVNWAFFATSFNNERFY
jgi:hypothetical protein